MKNISTLNNCYGCGLCAAICPKQIIKMRLNSNGFFSPIIDNLAECVNCGKCLNSCAYNSKPNNENNNIKYYAGYSNNKDVRLNASSGGIAYEIAKFCIDNGYKVVVVKYNTKSNYAEHYIANTIQDLTESFGSKYIQSLTTATFKEIIETKHDKIAFFGTPCQISSLRKYYNKTKKQVLLIDFFCHGVPSYLMWQKYYNTINSKIGKIRDVTWRDKSNGGWHNSWNMVISGENGKFKSAINEGDLFYKFFLRNRCLNTCCYDSCKYKMNNSQADVRIGDLWGEKYKLDECGISGIITFNTLGDSIVNNLKNCTIISEKAEVVMEAQMKKCAKKPASYYYVNKHLQTDKTLAQIDKTASRYEFWLDQIPNMTKYYIKRIFQILFRK